MRLNAIECDYLKGQKMRLFEKRHESEKKTWKKKCDYWRLFGCDPNAIEMRLFENADSGKKTVWFLWEFIGDGRVNLGCGRQPAKPCGHP